MTDERREGPGETADGRARMRDVSHTPPWGDDVTQVWHRGPAAVADADGSELPPDAPDRRDQASD